MIQPGVSIIDDDDAQITTLTDRVKRWCSPVRRERITLQGEKLGGEPSKRKLDILPISLLAPATNRTDRLSN